MQRTEITYGINCTQCLFTDDVLYRAHMQPYHQYCCVSRQSLLVLEGFYSICVAHERFIYLVNTL